MFDDHITPKSTNASQGSGQAPANLPFAEPEDVFASVEPRSDAQVPQSEAMAQTPQSALGAGVLKPAQGTQQTGSAVPVPPESVPEPPRPQIPDGLQGTVPEPPSAPEDMLAVLDGDMSSSAPMNVSDVHPPERELDSLQEKPVAPPMESASMQRQVSTQQTTTIDHSFDASSSVGTQMPPQLPQDATYRIKEPTLSRGIMGSIIVGVVVLILGGGGWWIYHAVVADVGTDTGGIETPTAPVEPATDLGSSQTTEGTVTTKLPPINIDDAVLFGLPADSDGDGLDDEQEATLGLNPKDWDSDNDELSDGDEVIIWETDPKNPDTDGDTFKDGTEVKAGYNPRGPGRIFEAPRLTENTAKETITPPVIGGTALTSTSERAAVIDAILATSPYQTIGSCTETDVKDIVLFAIEELIRDGYSVEATVWEDNIVGPVLMANIEAAMAMCTITTTSSIQ